MNEYLIDKGISGCAQEQFFKREKDCPNCEFAFQCTFAKLYATWGMKFNDDLQKAIKYKDEWSGKND